jgi:hypothetical protein
MTWVTWRQYRGQAAIAAALLAAFAAVMVVSGAQMASQWHSMLSSCTATDGVNACSAQPLGSTTGRDFELLSTMVPGILGIFWGAPLVAHELETGTGIFAWTQSVTRARWLTVKAGWLLLAAALWGGAVAALVTWWSGPPNALYGNAFEQNYFDVQGIVPVGYAVFATALGIAAGTLLRRTLPAIAVTLGGFIGLRVLVSDAVRPHYLAAVTTYSGMLANYNVPAGSWQLSSGVISKSGQVDALPASCRSEFPADLAQAGGKMTTGQLHSAFGCLQSAGFRHFDTYQPANRYWAFQGIETAIYLVLAAILVTVTAIVVARRDA